MATKNSKSSMLRAPAFSNKKLFVAFFVVMAALTVDISIGTTQDIVLDFAISPWGIALFVAIGAVYIVGQYYILRMIKAKTRESKMKRAHNLDKLQKIVVAFQYVLAAIMIFTILQIVATSQYYTNLLTAAQTISYGLAIFLMSLLAYWLFSWFKTVRTLVVLLYGLFAAVYVVNAVSTVIVFDTVLLSKPAIVTTQSEIGLANASENAWLPGFFTLQAITLNAYTVLAWAGTIILLRHNIQRLGKAKFWTLVITPLLFFMGFYITFYQTITLPPTEQQPDAAALLTMILLIVYSGMAAVILIGLGFFSIARSLRQQEGHVKDFMRITAYGLIIFFVSSGATIGQTGYPPFGLANVLFVGTSSFLIVTALYHSAVSISEDIKLRQSIRASTKDASRLLLDSIGSAEMQLEIEKKVVSVAKANADELAQESGVDSSITDEELLDYVRQAANELKEKYKRSSVA